MTLAGTTMIMSGGSRGIGEAIAVRAARDGANVVLLAKTSEPHPRLPGTIHTAAAAIEAAGGRALPLVGDVRDDAFVEDAVGTFLLSKLCIPHLRASANPHVLTLSPPISTDPRWFGTFTAYAIAKYAMSLVTLGLAEELRADGIACNSLWPRTAIDTAAVRNVVGPGLESSSRTPAIMADAAYAILTRPSRDCTGHFFIDDDVLEAEGVTDFSVYLNGGREEDLALDFWVDPKGPHDASKRL